MSMGEIAPKVMKEEGTLSTPLKAFVCTLKKKRRRMRIWSRELEKEEKPFQQKGKKGGESASKLRKGSHHMSAERGKSRDSPRKEEWEKLWGNAGVKGGGKRRLCGTRKWTSLTRRRTKRGGEELRATSFRKRKKMYRDGQK